MAMSYWTADDGGNLSMDRPDELSWRRARDGEMVKTLTDYAQANAQTQTQSRIHHTTHLIITCSRMNTYQNSPLADPTSRCSAHNDYCSA